MKIICDIIFKIKNKYRKSNSLIVILLEGEIYMTSRELDLFVRKYLNGDNDAFDDIYYETQTSVYLSIKTYIREPQVIEDLMQDTYVRAINNISKYKIGTNFKAWISCIARNIAINYYNREKKMEILEVDNPVFAQESEDSKLNYYLSFLEGIEKDIVIYHIVLNMKFGEIARIIEMPQSTVFAKYKSAINKIRKSI